MPYPARPVARDWDELFITGKPTLAAAEPEPEREERRRGFFPRMRENMRKTREALSAEVQATLFQGDLDEDTWERLEEALIYADVGARTTAQVVSRLEQEAEEGDLVGGEALTARLAELLAQLARTGTTRSTCGTIPPSSWSSASTAPARRRASASSPGTCARRSA